VAEELEVRYDRGAQAAVEGVSFSLGPGEGLVVTGPEGSGKTSLLRGLLGLAPCAGRVEVLGRPPGEALALRRVGYCAARRPFPPGLLAAELVRLTARVRGLADPEAAAAEALSRAGVARPAARADRADVEEARRLTLACALAGDADLLVMDEPWEFAETIAAVRDALGRGTAVLVATSDPGSFPSLLGRTLPLAPGAAA
jgi:zinc transport system ATP-binding protein